MSILKLVIPVYVHSWSVPHDPLLHSGEILLVPPHVRLVPWHKVGAALVFLGATNQAYCTLNQILLLGLEIERNLTSACIR
jgi:hypothetical protein